MRKNERGTLEGLRIGMWIIIEAKSKEQILDLKMEVECSYQTIVCKQSTTRHKNHGKTTDHKLKPQ